MALTRIKGTGITNLAVDTAQLAVDAVTSAKIEDNAVDTEHLADDAVEAAELASNAVVNDSVASDAAIATSKISGISGNNTGDNSVMASGNSYAAGLVPAGGSTHAGTFLRKDGTWSSPSSYTANLAVDPTNGTGTTSSEASHGYRGFLVFDNIMTTYWASAQNDSKQALPWDMEFDFTVNTIITKYALASFGKNIGLDDWLFQGHDGSSWTTLDTQTGQVGRMVDGGYIHYPISNTTAYGKYQLHVTGSDDNTYCYFRQIAMYGPAQ